MEIEYSTSPNNRLEPIPAQPSRLGQPNMAAPRIEVIGVYELDVTEELFREQFDILYGYTMSDEDRIEAEEQCREQLSSIVMIEVLIGDRDERFSVLDFTQAQDGVARDNWQVAYAETFLTLDGNSLLAETGKEQPQSGDLRGAFFMHFLGRDEATYDELW